jgi:hypothetical protein
VRTPLIVPAAGAAVLLLAGCTAASGTVTTSSSPAGPPAFPRISGTVVATAEPVAGDWTVKVRVADPASAYRAARALLTRHGFQLTSDEPVQDGGSGQACTTAICVSFDALTRPGERPAVEYEVFHSTGMAG